MYSDLKDGDPYWTYGDDIGYMGPFSKIDVDDCVGNEAADKINSTIVFVEDDADSGNAISEAWEAIKRHAKGNYGLVPMAKVRYALRSYDRAQQNMIINEMRRERKVSAVGIEGRCGTTRQEREDALIDPDPIGGPGHMIGFLKVVSE